MLVAEIITDDTEKSISSARYDTGEFIFDKSKIRASLEQIKRDLINTPITNASNFKPTNSDSNSNDFSKVIYGYFSSLTEGDAIKSADYWYIPSDKVKSMIRNAINNRANYAVVDANLIDVTDSKA